MLVSRGETTYKRARLSTLAVPRALPVVFLQHSSSVLSVLCTECHGFCASLIITSQFVIVVSVVIIVRKVCTLVRLVT